MSKSCLNKSDEPIQPEISKHLFMAATSSAFAELLTFPIDTVKVYLQLQTKQHGINQHLPNELEVGSFQSGMKSGHSHHTKLGINNLMNALKEIYGHHGLRGFFRGFVHSISPHSIITT